MSAAAAHEAGGLKVQHFMEDGRRRMSTLQAPPRATFRGSTLRSHRNGTAYEFVAQWISV